MLFWNFAPALIKNALVDYKSIIAKLGFNLHRRVVENPRYKMQFLTRGAIIINQTGNARLFGAITKVLFSS